MIDKIIDEIHKSIENECFIAALALTLTLPDICGKAEFPEEGDTKRYIDWYNEHIGDDEKPSDPYGSDMPYLSGEIIYNLRNALLHQGSPSIDAYKIKTERCKVDKFEIVIDPESLSNTSMVAYGTGLKIVGRELSVNLYHLCNIICRAATDYYNRNKEKFNFFKYDIVDKRDAII